MGNKDDYVHMDELSFAVYDVGTKEVETLDPDSNQRAFYETLPKGGAEDAVSILYEDILDWRALNIDHKRRPGAIKYALGFENQYESPSNAPDIPESLVESIQFMIERNYAGNSTEAGLDVIDVAGTPDLLVYSKEDPSKFSFVEVKSPPEPLRDPQKEWLDQFDFLPRKIACMFDDPTYRDQFIREKSFEALLEKPVKEVNSRPKMESKEITSVLEGVEIGDRLVFNDRKQPLEVVEKEATAATLGKEVTGVKVSSRRGSSQVLSQDGEWFTGSMSRRSLWWVDVLD